MTTWRYGIHDNITVKRIIINRQRSKSKNEIELPIRLRESSGHISSHMWRNNILFKFFSFVDFRFLWTPDYARHERICNKRIHWLRGNRNIACTWHFRFVCAMSCDAKWPTAVPQHIPLTPAIIKRPTGNNTWKLIQYIEVVAVSVGRWCAFFSVSLSLFRMFASPRRLVVYFVCKHWLPNRRRTSRSPYVWIVFGRHHTTAAARWLDK